LRGRAALLYQNYNLIGFKSKLESPTAIGDINSVKVPTQPVEFYTSIWRYDSSIAVLSLSDLPAGTVGYCDFLALDLDSHESLDIAYRDALLICEKLNKINAVYELHFSGGKGFHILIPTSQFGYEPTADEGILKRMAEGIKGDIKSSKEGGTWDSSIYNKTRVFRYPGTWNNKGAYKTYVKSSWENIELPIETILEKAKFEPAWPEEADHSDIPLNEALVQLYEFCKKPPEKPTVAVTGDMMFAPAREGGRNEQAFTIAHRLFKKGLFKQDVDWILRQWNSTNPKPLSSSEIGKVLWSAEKGRPELLEGGASNYLCSIDSMLGSIPSEMSTKKRKFATGYPFLDEFTIGGFEEEETVFIEARSANFKTATLTNILQRGTSLAKKPGILFSQEMGMKTLRPRLIQQAEGLTKAEVLQRMAQGDQFEKTREAFQHLTIVYQSNLTTELMMEIIEAFYKVHGNPSVVGVDYLGLFKGCNNDTAKTAKQAQELKTIVAKEAHCPVFTLTQAKQSFEGRDGDRELRRNAGKDSDSILDLSDFLIGMWGHWYTFLKDDVPTEEKFIFGRLLKARGMDSDKYPPNPYIVFDWDKPKLQLKDILWAKNPPRFKQASEE
jgi:hypothetical protein